MKRMLTLACVAVMAAMALGQTTVPVWLESPENLWRLQSSLRREGDSVEAQEDVAIKFLFRSDCAQQIEVARACTEFLGRIRSVNGIDILCERLLLVDFTYSIVGLDGMEYPAAEALKKIGGPAETALLSKITEADTTETYRDVALEVMQRIEAQSCTREDNDRLQSVWELQRRIERAIDVSSKQGKERLTALRAQFENKFDSVLHPKPREAPGPQPVIVVPPPPRQL